MFDVSYDEDEIIRQLGIENSEPTFRASMLARIRQLLDERIGIRIEGELTEAELVQFSQFIEANKPPDAQAFLKTRFPNIQEMYAEELDQIIRQLQQALDA